MQAQVASNLLAYLHHSRYNKQSKEKAMKQINFNGNPQKVEYNVEESESLPFLAITHSITFIFIFIITYDNCSLNQHN